MRLVPVSAFTQLPDGRLRIGPLRGPISWVRITFNRFGIRLSALSADQVMVSGHAQGIVLSCSGPGVRGYLLDAEGLEAPSSDVDALFDHLLPEGAVCRVSGHYRAEEAHMVESEALFWRASGRIISSDRRELIRADGTRRMISARSAPPARRGEGVRRLIAV